MLKALATTSQRRVIVAKELPRRLQKRCEGLDPVSLRLTLAAMGVPEHEIIREKSIRRVMAPPPPPLGIAKKMPTSFGYPNPTTFPEVWVWSTPSLGLASSGGLVTTWADQTGNGHTWQPFGTAPTSTTVTINGATAINFSSVDGLATLTTPSTKQLNFESLQYFTCFAVIQPEGSLVTYGRVWDVQYTTGFCLLTNSTAGAWKLIVADGTSPYGTVEGGVPALGTPALLTGIFNNGTATLQVNGTTVSTGTFTNPSTNSESNVAIGYGAGARPQSGYYGDQCLCVGTGNAAPNPQPTAALSGTTLLNANRFFGAEYGISVP
jgi:hypothetical protein